MSFTNLSKTPLYIKFHSLLQRRLGDPPLCKYLHCGDRITLDRSDDDYYLFLETTIVVKFILKPLPGEQWAFVYDERFVCGRDGEDIVIR